MLTFPALLFSESAKKRSYSGCHEKDCGEASSATANKRQKPRQKSSLHLALWKTLGVYFIYAGFFKFAHDLISLVSPLILR